MPTLITQAGQWVDAAGNVHAGADAFALRATEPTAANTGPRIAEGDLGTVNGNMIGLSAGDTITGRKVTGYIRPTVPLAAIRDTLVLGGDNPTQNAAISFLDSGITTVVPIEFCEVRISHPGPNWNGLKGGNFDLYRSKVTGSVDGLSTHGSGAYPANNMKTVRIRGCYVADLWEGPDPNQDNGVTHNDAVQSAGALDVLEIIGCALHGGNTTCILLQQNQGDYGSGTPIVVEDNWLYAPPEEDIFAMSNSRSPLGPGRISFKRNRINRQAGFSKILVKSDSLYPANYGMIGTDGTHPSTWTPGPDCNVFMDNGQPVPISPG